MDKRDFYILGVNVDDDTVVMIKRFEGVAKPYLLKDGVKLGNEFPSDAIFDIAQDAGDVMTDIIDNIGRQLIVNQTVKNFLIENGIDDNQIEYLPFKIRHKNGKIDEDQFYIANPLQNIFCMDFDNSTYKYNSAGDQVRKVRILHINTAKVPENSHLFRLGEEPSRVIISGELVRKIESESFTGLGLSKMGDKL